MKKAKTEFDRMHELFTKKRYDEAIAAGNEAVKNDIAMKSPVRGCLRSARLLQKLANTSSDDGVTSRLQSGWYSQRIGKLIEENRLQKIASVPVSMDAPLPVGNANPLHISGFEVSEDEGYKTGCAVVMRIGGAQGPDWEEVGNYCTQLRNIPANVLRGSFMDQWTDGRIFLKDSISSFMCQTVDDHDEGCSTCQSCQSFPLPMYKFPLWSVRPAASVTSAESELLDVHYGTNLVPAVTRAGLRHELDALAEKRKDSPAPKYHNIVDPNVGAVNDLWVPTELDVSERPPVEVVAALERACEKATDGSKLPQDFVQTAWKMHSPALAAAELRSPIPDLDPHENAELYVAVQDVMEAAVPLLARLRLPALLVPGPLQAVVKAQRIVLKEGETYEGVWHEDGLRENVVAVVLYYYRVSPTLTGGDIEIASKMPSVIHTEFEDDDFSEAGMRETIGSIPRTKVPVSEGTLLVFGNYAAVHRVLPMKAVGGPGSRDFLAFFIIDQRSPLPMHRDLGPWATRRQRRAELLREQLQPRGSFGLDGSNIYSTGNGESRDLAWLSNGGKKGTEDDYSWFEEHEDFFKISAMISQMSIPPPVLGRGLSFLTQYDGARAPFKAGSAWVQHIIGKENPHSVFVNTTASQHRTEPPKEGVRSAVVFDSIEEWQALGFTPALRAGNGTGAG